MRLIINIIIIIIIIIIQGGNIPGAINIPAGTLLDAGNDLIAKYRNVPLVIFHCALSQQRGPKSARIYNEMRHLTGEKGNQEVKDEFLFFLF